MTYRVTYSSKARRALSVALPESVAAACIEFIGAALAENPHRAGKALRSPLEGLHSARRGAFRVVYRIAEGAVTVLIVTVEHRGTFTAREGPRCAFGLRSHTSNELRAEVSGGRLT